MKNFIYCTIILLLFCNRGYSQVINFTDSAFKTYLLNHQVYDVNWNLFYVDTNNNQEIEMSEASEIYGFELDETGYNISDIQEIRYFTNLRTLAILESSVNDLDISFNVELDTLAIDTGPFGHFNVDTLDISTNPGLKFVHLSNCWNTELIIGENTELIGLNAWNLKNSTFNLDNLPNLEEFGVYPSHINGPQFSLYINNCPALEYIILEPAIYPLISITNCPSLTYFYEGSGTIQNLYIPDLTNYEISTEGFNFLFAGNYINSICCSPSRYNEFASLMSQYPNSNCVLSVSEFCEPPKSVYVKLNYDTDSNGCDANDSFVNQYNINVSSTNQNNEVAITNVDDNGYKVIYVADDTVGITPYLNSAYFSISPPSQEADLTTSPIDSLEFCVTPLGAFDDFEVVLVPNDVARPGFNSAYTLKYRNSGTTTLSGSVTLQFDNNHMNLVSVTPANSSAAANSLTWNFSNLAPFEERSIAVEMQLNTPTNASYPLNGGDVLSFTASAPISNDQTPANNTFTLNQEVVNSYDPNDKIMLEGESITPDMVGEFVTYRIRFENTGTANAVNIMVEDELDPAKFDISSLKVEGSSHPVNTKVEGNLVQFKFNNINLPFDDANNDGYVMFKVKTLSSLILGDTFSNDADIYFDYNSPIVTNNFVTTVENLSVEDVENAGSFSIYPNPAKDYFSIKSNGKQISKVEIYSADGKLMSVQQSNDNRYEVGRLNSGMYLLKIYTKDDKASTEKLIIQ